MATVSATKTAQDKGQERVHRTEAIEDSAPDGDPVDAVKDGAPDMDTVNMPKEPVDDAVEAYFGSVTGRLLMAPLVGTLWTHPCLVQENVPRIGGSRRCCPMRGACGRHKQSTVESYSCRQYRRFMLRMHCRREQR